PCLRASCRDSADGGVTALLGGVMASPCPRALCSGQLRLDTDFLRDAEKFGMLEFVPLYFRCTLCAHSFWSRPPVPMAPVVERRCQNPGCGHDIGRGRRRFCSDSCARPRAEGKRQRVRETTLE